MDERTLYAMLTNTLWQDFKGFRREEWKTWNKYFDPGSDWLYIIPIVNCFALAWYLLKLLLFIIIYPFTYFAHCRVSSNSYDIEVTTSEFKLTRNKKGKIGLCYWQDWLWNKQLLRSKYSNISRSEGECFIVVKDNKYGLYNGVRKKMVLKCKYEKINHLHDNVYTAMINGVQNKYNSEGDRLLQ